MEVAAPYTAEPNALQTEGIGRAEDGSDIVLAAHIVEYHDQWHFLGVVEGLGREAIHLWYSGFLHMFYLYSGSARVAQGLLNH